MGSPWHEVPNLGCFPFSRVTLLFYFHISGQDGCNLALHEGPGDVGSHQGALFTTGAIDLSGCSLGFNEIPGTRETELVPWHRGALDEVGILQPLMTDGTAERGTAGTSGGIGGALRAAGLYAAGRVRSR